MIKKILKFNINLLIKPLGLKVYKVHEQENIKNKYNFLIKQVEDFFNEVIYPGQFKNVSINNSSDRLELISGLAGTNVSEAFYILGYLKCSLKLRGDICEFGIANGATSVLLANELRNAKKNLWLFDSFQGLSKPQKKDILINDIFGLKSMNKYQGLMSYSRKEVEKKMMEIKFPFSRLKIVSGFIEDTLITQKAPHSVCFAYLDMDLYEPTKIALNFLHNRISKGGIIVLDDYDYFTSGVKTAVGEFIKNYSLKYKKIFPYKFAGNFCILKRL